MSDGTRVEELIKSGAVELTRQLDWLDPQDPQFRVPVTVVGCGGVGSHVAPCLSHLGITQLYLIDPDIIEAHNLPNQHFPLNSVGKPKVEVLKQICTIFGTADAEAIQKRVEDCPEMLSGIVVTGLDSMEARKNVWEIVKLNPRVKHLIDVRLGGLGYNIWSVDPHNVEQTSNYEEFALFSDDDAEEAPCTARAIIYVGYHVAGEVGRMVHRVLLGENPKTFGSNLQHHTMTEF